ncbi:MAG TPA: hypothetical protein VFA11_08555 [Acidimicrobiales bacterium]|nr:hypothetical protein [Acidimicrobiales bacterium]
MNGFIDAGFILEELGEPCADEALARRRPEVADSRIAPFSLIVRARRP